MDTQTKRFAFAILLMQDQLIDLDHKEEELATKIDKAAPHNPKWVHTLQQALDNVHAWQKELRDAVNVLEAAQNP